MRRLHLGQLGPNGVGHVDDIGFRLANDADRDGRRAVETERTAFVFGPQLDPAEVFQLDQLTALAGHDEVGELGRRLELAEGTNGEFAPLGLDPAGRHFHIPRADGLLHVLDGKPTGGQLGGGEPDPHGKPPLSVDARAAYPGQRLKPLLDQPITDVRQLEQVVVLTRQSEPEERVRISLFLGNDRLAYVLR
jgi:hypothetical protein